jgi:Zn-dependent peptidase ImmA (M78 family)
MNDLDYRIAAALEDLYSEADASVPTVEQCITPLSALVGAYNLTCTEVRELSSAAASNSLLQRGGLLLPLDSTSSEPLAGFLYAEPRHGAIFVERDDRLTRRRFSIAHELGHYLLHFRPILLHPDQHGDTPTTLTDALLREMSDDATPDDLQLGHVTLAAIPSPHPLLPPLAQMEREANAFAATLLMPGALLMQLREHWRRTYWGEDLVWRLATDMLVSRATMRWRLQSLGLVVTRPLWN